MRSVFRSAVGYASVMAGLGLAVVVSGQQIGCSSGSAGTGGAGSESVGTVGMSLTLPGGDVLNTVTWTITGPNGASTIVQQGSVNVQHSNTIAFTVSNIPAGSGYTVTLTGTTADGATTCSGSATFSVIARATTNVTVLMRCSVGGTDAGSASFNGQTYNCATANGVSASPSETTVGSGVALSATTATAPDPASVTYAWSAPSGTFSSASGPSTTFTCTAPGAVVVTLTTADGPVPAGASCDPSLSTTTTEVQCDSPLDAGPADATVDSEAGTSPDGGGPTACALGAGGAIKHVIYVQFDNTHLDQDVPNVASDLEQMPHLLSFIRGNGTMMANDHTITSISHTGGGILSTLTGVYPDRHGQTVSNSYVRTSATGSFSFPSTFQYWSDTVATNVYNLTQPDGTNMPAPWLPYTRSGCNVGGIAVADMELESVSTSATGDITNVFGAGSPQFNEAKSNSSKAVTDFEGIAVHCAQGSAVCAGGEADTLPASQGYTGFMGLFGTQQIDPLLTGSDAGTALIDLLGNPIQDTSGNPGFPGFNGMEAAVSLAYVAAMQESGIPVTFAYISDAHDSHVGGSGQAAFGPGQQGYTQQLAAYDQAFANFFARLASDGINQSNTLCVCTEDEGDHYVGVAPTTATCDGTPGNFCSYPAPGDAGTGLGEVNINIDLLLSSEQPAVASQFVMGNKTNPGAPYDFTVHGDDAPTFYLSRVVAGDAGQPTGALAQTDPVARQLERAAATLTAVNPYTGNTDGLLFAMADQAGMKAIHMFTAADPGAEPDVRLLRQRRLLRHRLPDDDVRRLRQLFVRLEPRRRPERHRPNMGRLRRPRRLERERRTGPDRLDRPHRRSSDHALHPRFAGWVRPRRARHHPGASAGRLLAQPGLEPDDRADAWRRLQADKLAVRRLRAVHPDRLDVRSPGRRRHLHIARVVDHEPDDPARRARDDHQDRARGRRVRCHADRVVGRRDLDRAGAGARLELQRPVGGRWRLTSATAAR